MFLDPAPGTRLAWRHDALMQVLSVEVKLNFVFKARVSEDCNLKVHLWLTCNYLCKNVFVSSIYLVLALIPVHLVVYINECKALSNCVIVFTTQRTTVLFRQTRYVINAMTFPIE